MKTGFVVIYRSIWGHPLFKKTPMSEREAFMWMVSQAAFKKTQHRVGSAMVDVERGSFLTTLRSMQHHMLWSSDKKVIGFLKLVTKEGMITTKVVGRGGGKKTQVTICNYSKYQDVGGKQDVETTALGTQAGRKQDVVKNNGNKVTKGKPSASIENGISESNKNDTKKRATRLPDDWALPDEWGQWALTEGWDRIGIGNEADKFKDYWIAVGGQKGTKLDWQATWRNWIRNSKQRTSNGQYSGKPSRADFDTKHREYARRLTAGEIERGPDPSDPFGGR